MAIAFSRYVDGTASSSSTAATVNLTACSAGDLVFVLISRAATVAPTSYPSGWSSSNLIQNHASTYGIWLYAKVLATGENVSSSWGWAASAKTLCTATVYTGAVIKSSAKGTFATASGTSVDCGSITSSETWLAQFCSGYSTATKSYNALTGYTERRDYGTTTPDFWQLSADTNNTWGGGACAPDFVYASSLSCTYRGGMIVELETGARTIGAAATLTGALSSSASLFIPVVYTSSLTGLDASTDYHVRAYVTNAAGTSYGSEVDFTSGAGVSPNTLTSAATLTGALSSAASLDNTPPARTITTAATLTGAASLSTALVNTPPARTITSSATLTGALSSSADLVRTIPAVTATASATLTGPLSSSASLITANIIVSGATLTGPLASSAALVNTPPARTITTSATLTGPLSSSASIVNWQQVTVGTAATITGSLASSASLANTPPARTITTDATLTGALASSADLITGTVPITIESSATLTGPLSSSATIANVMTLASAATLTGALSSAASLVNTPPARTITTAATIIGSLSAAATLVTQNIITTAATLTGPLVSSASLVNTPPARTMTSDATLLGSLVSAATIVNTPPATTISTSLTLTGSLSSSATVGTGDFYSSSLTGLSGNTTYHVRSWATNSSGIAYGNEVDFTTDAAPAITVGAAGTLTGAVSSSLPIAVGLNDIVINSAMSITSYGPNGRVINNLDSTLTGSLSSSASLTTELLSFPNTISAVGAAAGCSMTAIQCKLVLVKPSANIYVREGDTFPVEVTLSPAVPTGYLWILGATDGYQNMNLDAGVTDGIRTSWIEDSYIMNYTEGHQPPGFYDEVYFYVWKWPEYSYLLVPWTDTGLTITIYESEITAEIGATGAAAGCNMELHNTFDRENAIDVTAAKAGVDMYISQNKMTATFADPYSMQYGAPVKLVVDFAVPTGRGFPDQYGEYPMTEGLDERILPWIQLSDWSWHSGAPFNIHTQQGVTHYEVDVWAMQEWDQELYDIADGEEVTWAIQHWLFYNSSTGQDDYGNEVDITVTCYHVAANIGATAAAAGVQMQAYNYGAAIDARAGAATITAQGDTRGEHFLTMNLAAAKASSSITARNIRYPHNRGTVARSSADAADRAQSRTHRTGGIIVDSTSHRATQKKGAVDGFDNN